MRSPPERSTRRAMPGYFASKALAMRSATGRSTAVYQLALPSFLAASISWSVTGEAARPACAKPCEEVAASAVAASPWEKRRRLSWALAMIVSCQNGDASADQRLAARCRQDQVDAGAGGKVGLRQRRHAQLDTAADLDNIVAGGAEEGVA